MSEKTYYINIIYYFITKQELENLNCFDSMIYFAISKLVDIEDTHEIFEHVDIQDEKTNKIYGIRKGGKIYKCTRKFHPDNIIIQRISLNFDEYKNLMFFMEDKWKSKKKYNEVGFYWNFLPHVKYAPKYFMHDSKSESYFCSQLIAEGLSKSRIIDFKTNHNMLSPNKLYSEIKKKFNL